MMNEVRTVAALRAAIAEHRRAGKRIAFVPTMGNLHAGHGRLMEEARRHAEIVIASIYVNPLQFGAHEDFGSYPQTLGADRALAEKSGVDLLFVPDEAEIYPLGREQATTVEVGALGNTLCGTFRPGHFRGVASVVARFFNIVTPDVALFGRKDYQQLRVIERMVKDLSMPIGIIGVETVREPDGLAMSSRNSYLAPEERRVAPRLHATLCAARDAAVAGSAELREIERNAVLSLSSAGFVPEYVAIRRQSDLAPPEQDDRVLVILAATRLGQTRLIDNVEFERFANSRR
jgi:pantoate--beta-alanine ligase